MISNLSFMQFFLLFVSIIIIISLSCVPAFVVVVMFCMLLASLHFLLAALP